MTMRIVILAKAGIQLLLSLYLALMSFPSIAEIFLGCSGSSHGRGTSKAKAKAKAKAKKGGSIFAPPFF